MTNGLPSIQAYNGVLKGQIPCWAVRPGALEVLRPLAQSLHVWLAIRSINGLEMAPCTASETTLAQLTVVSRATLRSRLKKLRESGLLFEVHRGRSWKTGRFRPVGRWATDPAEIHRFKEILSGWRLAEVAMETGLGGQWISDARRALEVHVLVSLELGQRMRADLPEPCIGTVQDAGGSGGVGQRGKRGRAGEDVGEGKE